MKRKCRTLSSVETSAGRVARPGLDGLEWITKRHNQESLDGSLYTTTFGLGFLTCRMLATRHREVVASASVLVKLWPRYASLCHSQIGFDQGI